MIGENIFLGNSMKSNINSSNFFFLNTSFISPHFFKSMALVQYDLLY